MKFTINNFFSTIILFIFICGTTTIVKGQSTAVTSLQLIVDFTSTVSYIDSECGGSLLSTDLTIYPPCKSFKDAGDRARQYLGQSPLILIPNNNALIISVVNSAITPIISGQSTQLGNLYGFCLVDISISTGETHITLDGSLATDSFITYKEPNTPYNFQCTSNKSLKVRYMKFINWEQQTIFSAKVNQVFNNGLKTGLIFQYLMVENSTSVINFQPKSSSYEYGSFIVSFTASQFTGVNPSGTSLVAPFNLIGSSSTFSSCIIANSIITASPLVYQERGSLILRSSTINQVNINNAQSLVKTVNVGYNYNIIYSTIANSTLSSFYHGSNSVLSQVDATFSANFASNIFFGNNIINSANGVSNGLIFNQRYQGQTYIIDASDLNIDNNNFSANKPIFSLENTEILIRGQLSFPSQVVIVDTKNSISRIRSLDIYSIIPVTGNNSYIYFDLIGGTFPLNFVNCEICLVNVDQNVVYNTFV